MRGARKTLIAGIAIPALVAASIAAAPSAFAATVNVDIAPIRMIVGGATLLSTPAGVARDAAGRLYVLNAGGLHVTVYTPTANGNVAPTRIVTAPDSMYGIGVAPNGTLAVTLQGEAGVGRVLVYGLTSTSPDRIINGASTGIDLARGVAISNDGTTYVTNSGNQSITVFGPTADGDVSPVRTIAGGSTGLSSPVGIARRTDGSLVVANYGNHGILTFGPSANGNVAPIRTIFGGATDLQSPLYVALDTSNRIYTTSPTLNQVKVFAANANGNVEPIVRNEGPQSQLPATYGIAVAPNGQYSVAGVAVNQIPTYPALFNQAQVSVAGCVRALRPAAVRKNSLSMLMRGNCRTTAGRAVTLRILGDQNAGGVPRFRVLRNRAGAVSVKTFGSAYSFRAVWRAPATVTHRAFLVVRGYARR